MKTQTDNEKPARIAARIAYIAARNAVHSADYDRSISDDAYCALVEAREIAFERARVLRAFSLDFLHER
jgi:hypothetical protein